MNAVTSLTWVSRGVAKSKPDAIHLTDEELGKLIESTGSKAGRDEDDSEDESNDENVENDSKTLKDEQELQRGDSIETKYHLDEYDNDDDEQDDDAALSLAALSFYPSNQQDPYMSKDPDSEDDDDMTIASDDNLIVIGKVHGDYFSLEVWVNNAGDGNLYCHHDNILANCPLVLEWVGYDPGESSAGNLVAVGSMSPDIEIWDLDVVNTVEPAFTLKGESKRKKSKANKAKKMKRSHGHTDAVLGLSWNKNRHQILASASADESVGIWDLSSGTAVSMLRQHGDKVQAVQWHPVEDQLLLSGCFDGCVRLFDCRSSSGNASRQWSVGGEIEKMIWNHHDPFYLFAGTDTGLLSCMDVRNSTPLYTHSAHTAALTSLALSPSVIGCLVTASDDRSMKVWDVTGSTGPLLVSQRNCKIGAVHCGAACPDEPLLFCIGGDREMKVINLRRDEKVTSHFGSGLVETAADAVSDMSETTVESPKASESSTDMKSKRSKLSSSKTAATSVSAKKKKSKNKSKKF